MKSSGTAIFRRFMSGSLNRCAMCEFLMCGCFAIGSACKRLNTILFNFHPHIRTSGIRISIPVLHGKLVCLSISNG